MMHAIPRTLRTTAANTGMEDAGLAMARARVVMMMLHARALRFRPAAENPACVQRLTARELEVAQAVSAGFSNKEAAAILGLSVRTIENHLRSVFAKVNVSTRTRLAAKLRAGH